MNGSHLLAHQQLLVELKNNRSMQTLNNFSTLLICLNSVVGKRFRGVHHWAIKSQTAAPFKIRRCAKIIQHKDNMVVMNTNS